MLLWWPFDPSLVPVCQFFGGCLERPWLLLGDSVVAIRCCFSDFWVLLSWSFGASLVDVGCFFSGCFVLLWWLLAASLVGV